MANHIYSLIPSFNSGGQFAQSVWHWQFDDAGFATSKAAAQALITAFDSARRTTLRNCLPADANLLSYRSSRVDATGGFTAFTPVAAPTVGTRPGTQSATALNPVVILISSVPYKGRGKWFVPGISETDIANGIFTAAYTTAMAIHLGTLFSQLVLSGGGNPTATFGWITRPGLGFHAMITNFLSQNLGTQRRRMRPA